VTEGPKAQVKPLDDLLALEDFLSLRVSILAKLLERRLARLLGEHCGLAVTEYRVLAVVAMRPRATVRDIAARTFVDKAQVSRVATVLEKQDLIRRSTSGTDRRSPEFTVTPSGRALMNRIVPLCTQRERDLNDHLGAESAMALAAAVQSLTGMLTAAARESGTGPAATRRRRAIGTERITRPQTR
jgi:DNA-binding MarR family transcriptional regulator